MSILSRALSVLESSVSQTSVGRPQHLLVCVWLSGVVACQGDGTTVLPRVWDRVVSGCGPCGDGGL